jgi:hypothetical protein
MDLKRNRIGGGGLISVAEDRDSDRIMRTQGLTFGFHKIQELS